MAEPPTPSGPILQPLASLRTWLADLTACQTLLAADDATEAAARIYLAEIDLAELSDAEKRAKRPCIVLMAGDGATARRIAAPNTWADEIPVTMGIWLLPSETYTDRDDQYVAACNLIGDLEDDMRDASGIGGPNIAEIARTTAPRRTSRQDAAAGWLDEISCQYDLACETGD